MTRTKKLLAGALVAAAAAGATTTAYAYWTTNASGSGSVAAGTMASPIVENATATPSSTLVPGASADLVVQVNNPNAYAVTMTAIAADGGHSVSVNGAKGAGCTGGAAGLSLSAAALNITLNPGENTVHVPSGVSMSTSAPSACQGASFQIPTTVTAKR